VAQIRDYLDRITNELEQASASDTLRQTTVDRFAQLLDTATQATSIAHIIQAQQAAEPAFDLVLTAIEKEQAERVNEPGPDKTPKATVKKRRVVEVRALCTSNFIETQEDMETFLGKLRQELKAALDNNERVQIK
jgi:hypothetical protein